MEKEYRHFGVMLDVSRNAVMKVGEVKRMIDCLEKMGYNTLELYSEDTFEVENEPYFGYMRGRYTEAEIKEIDAYASAHGIELIPCVQTLAHFTNTLRHAPYAEIKDIDDILLIDDPKTYEFIENIFKTLAKNFTSRNVNIGMDEAHHVGLGKYLDKHGYENRFELLSRHLSKVIEIAKKYGFKAHMWSDMFYRLANNGAYTAESELPEEVKALLPEDIELTYWDYYRLEKSKYDHMLETHLSLGRKVWFAGGVWTWSGFAPLGEFSLRSMKAAMESVAEKGIQDVLMTMWGDNGKECSFFSVLHVLYAIRQYADGNFDQEKIKKGFHKTFGLHFDDFMLLDAPNRQFGDEHFDLQRNPAKALFYTDPFMGLYDKTVESQRPIPYAQYAAELAAAKKRAGRYGYVFESTSKLCAALAIKAELGVKIRRAYHAQDKKALAALAKECGVLVKRLEAFHEAFYVLWNTENKPQGWEIQDARIGGLIQRIKTCKKRLERYVKGKSEKIEELEEELLPFGDGKQIFYNHYERLVSFGSL